jgi:hypothetical protein
MKRRQSAASHAAGAHNWRKGQWTWMLNRIQAIGSYDHVDDLIQAIKEEIRLLDYDYEGEMRRIRARGR